MQADTRGSAKRRKISSVLVPVLTVLVSACFWAVAIVTVERNDARINREHARSLVQTISYTMQMSLKDYFEITRFWAQYIADRGTPSPEDFASLNKALDPKSKSLVAIALAPDGRASFSYPAGGANILGLDLFSDPERSSNAEWSRLARQTTLTGPFLAKHSGMVFEIGTPVYVSDGKGGSRFWGFSLCAVKEVPFFEEALLYTLLDEGFDYQLKSINSFKGTLDMVACSVETPLADAVSYTFSMQNTAWTLYVLPENGWVRQGMRLITLLVAVIFTLLASFAVNSFWHLITNERSFKRMSYVDSLTGLFNARKFYEDLDKLQKKMLPYALLYLDLNDFKPVNDNYGHKSGDQLLAIVALKMRRCVRGDTGVYRIGGDEFAIVIPNDMGMEGLDNLSLRIKSSLGQRITLENASVHIGTSIGYARCPSDGLRYTEVIQKAEAVMYADKKQQHARR